MFYKAFSLSVFLLLLFANVNFAINIVLRCSDSTHNLEGRQKICSTWLVNSLDNKTIENVAWNGESIDWQLNEVEVLYFQNGAEDLDYIPSNMRTSFPNLRKLSFQSTKLAQISKDDLKQFSRLESFVSFYNLLTTLPANLFSENPEMKELIVVGPNHFNRSNSLHTIGKDLLYNTTKLNTVMLVNNFCISNLGSEREDVILLNEHANNLCKGGLEVSTLPPDPNLPTTPPTTPGTIPPTTSGQSSRFGLRTDTVIILFLSSIPLKIFTSPSIGF